MVCNNKIFALLLLAGLSCAASGDSLADSSRRTSTLPSSWYKAAFETRFPPVIPSLPPANGWAVLYKNKADTMGKEYENIFQPVGKELNAALSATNTENPFRQLFSAIYAPASIEKRQQCLVLGTPFELDDKPASKEWVVSFSAAQCLSDDESLKLRQGDNDTHKWVVQKTPAGKYRVLAEGDGSLYVTNHNKEQGYKEIRTRLLLKYTFPDNPLQCGGAEFTWRYRNNGYYLADTAYMAQDCQPLHFPELTGEAWQNAYDEYERRAKLLVDEWLEPLKKAD